MANKKFNIKHYDLLPVFRLVCLDGDVPVDLTLATEARLLLSNRNTGLKVDAVMEVADQSDPDNHGLCTYQWVTGDTDTLGTYSGEIQVLWPGQAPQTFPAKGYFTVIIGKDLNNGPTESS